MKEIELDYNFSKNVLYPVMRHMQKYGINITPYNMSTQLYNAIYKKRVNPYKYKKGEKLTVIELCKNNVISSVYDDYCKNKIIKNTSTTCNNKMTLEYCETGRDLATDFESNVKSLDSEIVDKSEKEIPQIIEDLFLESILKSCMRLTFHMTGTTKYMLPLLYGRGKKIPKVVFGKGEEAVVYSNYEDFKKDARLVIEFEKDTELRDNYILAIRNDINFKIWRELLVEFKG